MNMKEIAQYVETTLEDAIKICLRPESKIKKIKSVTNLQNIPEGYACCPLTCLAIINNSREHMWTGKNILSEKLEFLKINEEDQLEICSAFLQGFDDMCTFPTNSKFKAIFDVGVRLRAKYWTP